MRSRWTKHSPALGILVFLAFSVLSFGQSTPTPAAVSPQNSTEANTSLAATVRNGQKQKTAHAKKVFTDDDVDASAGPLPRLRMSGAENADEVVVAIAQYKASHTPEQTEEAVRRWYETYDEDLAAAIQSNLDIKALRDANVSNGYELCQQSQNYQECQSRQMAESRGARQDQIATSSNSNLVVRIQHSFMKIRNGLQMNNLRYDWFKIRTTNNIDTF